MARETVEKRVDRLEGQIKALGQLPTQIVHLREEMRSEFSAIRQEMREQGEALRQEMREQDQELRQEMRELFAESERHARVLHEDVIARIAALRER